MQNMLMKFRFKALGLHLSASACALSLILGALYLGWYFWPGWARTDVTHVVVVMVGVDVVVGPLLTFVIAHPGKTVAVFCHGGVVNVWTAHVLGMAPRLFFEPVYASVHRYLCASTGQRNIVSLNERCHLD